MRLPTRLLTICALRNPQFTSFTDTLSCVHYQHNSITSNTIYRIKMADKESGTGEEALVENGHVDKPSTDEDLLFEAVRNGNVSDVRRLASLWNIKIDQTDKGEMTALMHAAYKGDAESVDILITHGADVNRKSTEHGYTPLMFATLAGSKEAVKLLLEAGADPSIENKVNKTAAQLGAFVGRHDCVSLINNYIGKEDIQYYTKPQGLETEAKLSPILTEPLQNYIIITNLNPVHLCLFLNENISLVENSKQVSRVLEIKRDRLFRQELNEVISIKVHYLYCVHEICVKWHGKDDGIHALIRKFLKGRVSDGFPMDMEDFIRNTIRSFPFRESNLFKHIVKTLAGVEKGNEPTALSVLTQSVQGLQSANFSDSCYTCGKRQSTKKCANCKVAMYCKQDCQRLHWFTHKKHCKSLALEREQEELEMRREMEKQQKEMEAKEQAEKEVRTEEEANSLNPDGKDLERSGNEQEHEAWAHSTGEGLTKKMDGLSIDERKEEDKVE